MDFASFHSLTYPVFGHSAVAVAMAYVFGYFAHAITSDGLGLSRDLS
jgi:hypothetical protein